jgi:diguanylate cyclase (GGDEF)-like protein
MKLMGSKVLEHKEIQSLIDNGLNYVHFSKPLEPIYREQYKNEAAREFRYRAPIILALYVFLSFGIYQTIPDHNIILEWLTSYIWVGLVITLAWVLSLLPRFNTYFDLYVGIGSTIAVAVTFVIIANISREVENILIHASMMYAVVIIYGFVGMRFYTAIIAGWLGGLIGIIFCHYSNIEIGWTVLHRTYTFSSFLGMALAYAIDRQHRENYLQHCIIELNNEKMTQQATLLEKLSQQDALTGLANRRHLNEVLDQQWRYALRYQTPFTVFMVDIDCFKNYNDKLGHLEGDACIQMIANVLKNITGRSYELAARYGGEEFMLVFPMVDQEQAKNLAALLIEHVSNLNIPHPNSTAAPYVTVSVGVATTIPKLDQPLSEFLAMADYALYQAKIAGRNQYRIAHRFVA